MRIRTRAGTCTWGFGQQADGFIKMHPEALPLKQKPGQRSDTHVFTIDNPNLAEPHIDFSLEYLIRVLYRLTHQRHLPSPTRAVQPCAVKHHGILRCRKRKRTKFIPLPPTTKHATDKLPTKN